MGVRVTDYDRAGMFVGFDIPSDFALGMHDPSFDKAVQMKGKLKGKGKNNRSESVSKMSTNSGDPEVDSKFGDTISSLMNKLPPSALKANSRFLVNDKLIQGNNTRETFNTKKGEV